MLGGADEGTDGGAADRLHGARPAPGDPAADRQRRGRHRDRHPRAARGERHLRRPRPGRRRRAAPLRRRAARRPHRQGRDPAARPGDDGDADPAHGRDDRVRRPRGLDAHRAARRARPDPDQRRTPRGAAALDRPRLGAGARGGRQGPSGLRRVPADRRRRAGAGRADQVDFDEDGNARRRSRVAGGGRGARAELTEGPLAGLRVGMLHGRLAPRREGPHDARLRRRRHRRAGLDHRDRGRRRRRQRHDDGAARRRPVRRLPAPPAARPGRPGRAPGPVPARDPRRGRHPGARAARRGRRHDRRLRAVPGRPRARREGDVLGASQSGFRSSLQNLRVLRDEKTIVAAREAAEPLLDRRSGPGPGPAPGGGGGRAGDRGSLGSWRRHEPRTRSSGDPLGGRRRINTPRGVSTRPTSDRVREALFSAVEAWCGSLPASASSTCTPAPARSASRPGPAARVWSRWSSTTGAPPP